MWQHHPTICAVFIQNIFLELSIDLGETVRSVRTNKGLSSPSGIPKNYLVDS